MATSPVQNYTYNKLVELLKSYGERNDDAYTDQIQSFITLAENDLATEMKQQGFQCVVRGTFDPTNVLPKPTFWKETISFGYWVDNVWYDLFMRSLEYIRQYWPVTALTEQPKFYADYNFQNFYIAPTPPSNYPFELVYYARLDPLSPDHQENWMTLNAPQALLAACLKQSAVWRKNKEEIALFSAQYQQAVGALLDENRQRLADRNTGVKPR